MTPSVENSPDALCAEILAQARRESARIIRQAQTQAEAVLVTAAAEAEKILRGQREQTQAEAVRRQETILATVAVEAGRLRAARIEELLESFRAEISRRLEAQDFDQREAIITFAAEAIRQMSETYFVLKISTADQAAFGDELADPTVARAARARLHLSIAADAAVADGVVVESADGFQIWDNRLSARLERLWPELRRQIAVRAGLLAENRTSGGGA